MNYTTKVVQVTNVSPSTTSEQMRTLFGFLGTIEELKLFPPDDSQMPVTSRVCFVKFQEPESVGVSQHLTNTVFVDRALIVVPFAEGSIPDEAKALSLLAPANAVAGILPGGGLLPTPNPISNPGMGGNPFGVPNMDAMAAFGFPGHNMNPQAADQLLKFMTDPKLNPLAAGLNLSASLKADASNKEIEEAMKRVREAQSLISAAIEPGNKESKKKRSRSRSRRRRSRSRSKHRRTRSKSRRRSNSRSKRRSKSPRRRHTDSRDQSKRSPSKSRDRKKDDSGRRRSKTPPKSYSTARRSRSEDRRRRRSRSKTRSPPKRKSPSPRRHKKEKKKDKERDRERRSDKERNREERERSISKKKKSKDKERERDRERDRERKSDGEKGDVKVSKSVEGNGTARPVKQAKVNGADDHHEEEDMDVSD
ncbi:serine/arginine-rich splicing factor 11-like isoform X3 [Cottoperca gobio]|uniref:Serine/arginine-rich splicing factor 11-like isoform X3 n=1 Tax=Cottoperca gobio TaxID=56716 RepID=A0A6J2RD38_COTGO|nr:serine/arginine-rich splicing factor 11-like isoform X3 [Cottoperca gobio]